MKNRMISSLIWAPAILFLGQPELANAQKSRHQQLTESAWSAFERGDYGEAIRQADTCISEFTGAADRRQQEIDANKEQVLNGRVKANQRDAIFKNGPLNDVSTCHYIKARAADKLEKKETAAASLSATAKYSAARAWDPKGRFFWSPAEAAERYRTNPELADKAPHEAYTIQAWNELNNGNPSNSIKYADKCINEFVAVAAEMQQDLAKRGVRLPTGSVPDAVKKKVFECGALNDVGTCMFIKGKAAEAMGDRDAAIAAYAQALKLPLARCWDTGGWFWSPAEGAADRIEIIRD